MVGSLPSRYPSIVVTKGARVWVNADCAWKNMSTPSAETTFTDGAPAQAAARPISTGLRIRRPAPNLRYWPTERQWCSSGMISARTCRTTRSRATTLRATWSGGRTTGNAAGQHRGKRPPTSCGWHWENTISKTGWEATSGWNPCAISPTSTRTSWLVCRAASHRRADRDALDYLPPTGYSLGRCGHRHFPGAPRARHARRQSLLPLCR